jgi:thymidylate kinase
MPNGRNQRSAMLVSFSGIDGAGKSTQIINLQTVLQAAGFRVRLLAFWDDVAMLRHGRETLSHAAFKSERGVGTPDKPVNRQDKNVKTWYLAMARLFLYLLDAISLAIKVTRTSSVDADVLICDRYLYDELANLSLGNPLLRTYARVLLRCVPRPDIAFLLDADPLEARQRKPEYPLDFLHVNRAAYLSIARMAGMTVVGPLPLQDATNTVTRVVLGRLRQERTFPQLQATADPSLR